MLGGHETPGAYEYKTGECEMSRDWSKSLVGSETPEGWGLGDFRASRLPPKVGESEVLWIGEYGGLRV